MRGAVETHISNGRILFGIGPMSINCIEAIYSCSQEEKFPIELIASRRQIEAKAFGHGYVNNWTTEEFGAHLLKMKKKYSGSRVFVCRDHGGPWQGDGESTLTFEEALARAKTSYCADIDSGFDLLHIDPSLNLDGKLTLERTLDAAKELLSFCSVYAKKKGKRINFEVGTEENVGKATGNEVFESSLKEIIQYCEQTGTEKPLFVVGQTGSLVKEMRQVGNFNSKTSGELAKRALMHGAYLKEHNADYISKFQLLERKEAKVPAMNVAPEFGVIESRAFVDFCMQKGKRELVRSFLELSVKSGKWKKWIVNNDYVSDYERGLISGHYVFGSEEFSRLKNEAGAEEFDSFAKGRIKERVGFYCRN